MSSGLSILRFTFLGTSAAAPTATRNVSGLAMKADGELVLFDCGEGSQRQMIRFGTGFDVDAVFFTHFHADHYLGIIGFLRTLGMLGRERPLTLYGPAPAKKILEKAVMLGTDRLEFPVSIEELGPGEVVSRTRYEVRAFATTHRIASSGYLVVEETRPGSFDVERAHALSVNPGPDFGLLQRGHPVRSATGAWVQPGDVLGPSKPGRRVVISGDTRPCASLIEASRDAELLIHEATFSDEEQARAEETQHSTAREAGKVGREARVKRLVLTHLSARFESNWDVLMTEARAEYGGDLLVATDGLEVEVPLALPRDR